jgi:hypothetical protein
MYVRTSVVYSTPLSQSLRDSNEAGHFARTPPFLPTCVRALMIQCLYKTRHYLFDTNKADAVPRHAHGFAQRLVLGVSPLNAQIVPLAAWCIVFALELGLERL